LATAWAVTGVEETGPCVVGAGLLAVGGAAVCVACAPGSAGFPPAGAQAATPAALTAAPAIARNCRREARASPGGV
jgi:hypothetical protein